MTKVLQGNFGKTPRTCEGNWGDYEQTEDEANLIISGIIEDTHKLLEEKLGKKVHAPDFFFYSSDMDIQMQQILHDINIPPQEEEYIENYQYKLSLFRQRLSQQGYSPSQMVEVILNILHIGKQ